MVDFTIQARRSKRVLLFPGGSSDAHQNHKTSPKILLNTINTYQYSPDVSLSVNKAEHSVYSQCFISFGSDHFRATMQES